MTAIMFYARCTWCSFCFVYKRWSLNFKVFLRVSVCIRYSTSFCVILDFNFLHASIIIALKSRIDAFIKSSPKDEAKHFFSDSPPHVSKFSKNHNHTQFWCLEILCLSIWDIIIVKRDHKNSPNDWHKQMSFGFDVLMSSPFDSSNIS